MAIGPGGQPDELDIGDIEPRPRHAERHLWAHELVRTGLAIAFFLLLAVTVVWALTQVGSTAAWTNAKEALQTFYP